ncbi:hypothetical protein EYF80_018118 [Liparis tanakae]|uniref:Uncharacterized protein n=1 Tax=Liparis tanakae TaxID=230148 RepID=A0A4Z2I2X9_9TELE|nr:hypothetical protein EYF80_018118 [Liparis tanakae]
MPPQDYMDTDPAVELTPQAVDRYLKVSVESRSIAPDFLFRGPPRSQRMDHYPPGDPGAVFWTLLVLRSIQTYGGVTLSQSAWCAAGSGTFKPCCCLGKAVTELQRTTTTGTGGFHFHRVTILA